MRVLHVGKYFPPVAGGMERFLGDLVPAQADLGDTVFALVHGQRGAATSGDPVWLRRCPVWLRLAFAPISPAFPFWLGRAIRDFRPDVLHLHMPNLSALWALLVPAARRLPWVIHWHSDVEPSRFSLSLRLLYPHYRIFERALLDRADVIVATSPPYLESSRPLAPWRHKCVVVPLGVAPERLPPVSPEETGGLWRGDGVRLLAIGRLTYYKGFLTLLRAATRCPGMELIIVGEGEERPRLEAALARAGHPAGIRLLGSADDETCRRLLASCDIFCLPSLERTEAFGIVLMEAMRYGRPLVASRLVGSGVTWVARDGENAVLVEPEDESAWARALVDLAQDLPRRQRLGANGLGRYQREFAIRDVAGRLDELYRQITELVEDGTAGQSKSSGSPLVVIPALNEVASIGAVVTAVRARGFPDVLVIDDGSTDGTAAAALAAGARVMRAPLAQGAWGAMQTGIRCAVREGYSGVVTMDADGQHEPAYLQHLVDQGKDADVVIGACPERGSQLRRIAWAYFRTLTGFSFEDLTSGFRYYSGTACETLAGEEATLLDYQDIGVLLLLHRAGLRIREVPVAMSPRQAGASRIFSSWWTVGRYMAETTLLCMARWGGFRKRFLMR